MTASTPAINDPHYTGGMLGHPKGLNVLFFTELWERFSYYGMRAILILFMTATVVQGGLGLPTEQAALIYGTYTGSVYLASIPGGLIADRWLGPRKAILIGGIIIALGHFTMALPMVFAFYAGLVLIVCGTGFLKPNISTMVGKLYAPGDNRRDSGFSLFYMGINIGAMLSPLVCGYLAQDPGFKVILKGWGIAPETCWHFGFVCAGVGMCIGLAHLLWHYKLLEHVGMPSKKSTDQAVSSNGDKSSAADDKAEGIEEEADRSFHGGLTTDEWKKLGAIAALFFFNVLFWSIFEQGGSSLNLFADKFTNCSLFGFDFPSSWFQSLQPVYVIALAPVFSYIWLKLGDKQPTSPAKFAFGLFFLAIGIAIMIPASILVAQGKVSPLFLIFVYLVETMGELCLSPIGLSTVTKLAPTKFQSLTMGAWFVSPSIGNFVAGLLSKDFKEDASQLTMLFGKMAVATLIAAVILTLLVPRIKKLMGNVK